MNEDLIQGGSKDFTTDGNGRIPAGRWGKPEDFKGPVVFLASGASEWVHGETLIVSADPRTRASSPWLMLTDHCRSMEDT